MPTKWNGKDYSLEVFCSHHRSKHSQLVESSLHFQYQVPDEHTRVVYLIDNIEHQDVDLRAVIAQIRTNSSGTRNDFDRSVSILLSVDPYTKTPPNKKQVTFDISSVEATKFARGRSTGVDLRWHKKEEFPALSKDQKIELCAWKTTVEGRNATKGAKDYYFQSKGGLKRKSTDSNNTKTNKLKRQVVALQKR